MLDVVFTFVGLDFDTFDSVILDNAIRAAVVANGITETDLAKDAPLAFTRGSVNAALTVANATVRERVRASKDAITAHALGGYRSSLADSRNLVVEFGFAGIRLESVRRQILKMGLRHALVDYNVSGWTAKETSLSFKPGSGAGPSSSGFGAYSGASVVAVALFPDWRTASLARTHRQGIADLAARHYGKILDAGTAGPEASNPESGGDDDDDNEMRTTATLLGIFLGLSLLFLLVVAVCYVRLKSTRRYQKQGPFHEDEFARIAGPGQARDSYAQTSRAFDATMLSTPESGGASALDDSLDVLGPQHAAFVNRGPAPPSRRDEFGVQTPFHYHRPAESPGYLDVASGIDRLLDVRSRANDALQAAFDMMGLPTYDDEFSATTETEPLPAFDGTMSTPVHPSVVYAAYTRPYDADADADADGYPYTGMDAYAPDGAVVAAGHSTPPQTAVHAPPLDFALHGSTGPARGAARAGSTATAPAHRHMLVSGGFPAVAPGLPATL